MNLRGVFDRVFGVELPIAVAVFVIVCAVVAFALVRYRAGRGHSPSRKHKHPVAESVYAIFLVLVAGSLVGFTASENAAERASLGPPQVRVKIVAFQWCWRFEYVGTPVTVTGTCIDQGDDPTLVLPTDERVEVLVTSTDVVHEWWSPFLRFKISAFPDWTNSFEVDLTQTGSWPGRCSQYCGLYHYRMDFVLKAVPPAAFRAWLQAHERAPA
jgi:cytochrome c oxidase subunit 2